MGYAKRKYDLDESYFQKIDTPNKARILGFIFADGNVHSKKNNLSIQLHQKDRNVLEWIKKELNFNGPIKDFIRVNKYINSCGEEILAQCPQSVLSISSKQIKQDLVKLGCVPNKTLVLKFPTKKQVPQKLIPDFLLGYFFGDGCLSVYQRKGRNSKEFKWEIISTQEFCEKTQKILMKECNLNKTKFYPKGKNWELKYSGREQVARIFQYLWQNANDEIKEVFGRKYKKEVLKYIENSA